MAYISQLTVPVNNENTTYDLKDTVARHYITGYGTCATKDSVATKTVYMSNISIDTLYTGQHIAVKFFYGHEAGVTLSLKVGSTLSTTVYYNGNPFSGVLATSGVYDFMYDGIYWQILDPPMDGQVVVSSTEPTSSTAMIWITP